MATHQHPSPMWYEAEVSHGAINCSQTMHAGQRPPLFPDSSPEPIGPVIFVGIIAEVTLSTPSYLVGPGV
jgi:hypothetical protein